MNRTQKVITVLALLVFLAIGLAHMCETSTWDLFKKYEWVAYEHTKKPYPAPGTGLYDDILYNWTPVYDSAGHVKEWRWTEWRNELRSRIRVPSLRLANRSKDAILPDILTPWTMLAVTYAALMALTKRK
jgi:hypothetical protein